MTAKKRLRNGIAIPLEVVFGANVRRARQACGLSQVVCAENAGIWHTYLSRIECGNGNPRATVIESLAKVLGVSASELCKR